MGNEPRERETLAMKAWEEVVEKYNNRWVRRQLAVTSPVSLLTVGGIVPFSISAIVVVFGAVYVAEYAMAFGFGFLIVGVTLLVVRDRLLAYQQLKSLAHPSGQ
jgi:hypothetical protein